MPFLPYRPIGGINAELSEDLIGEEEVQDAQNFLFERGQAITRPGVKETSISGTGGRPVFAQALLGSTANPVIVMMTTEPALYSLNSTTMAATEITGSGFTLDTADPRTHSAVSVNGVIVIPTTTTGALVWDTSGSTYAIVSDAKYMFMTGHLSRAFGVRLDGNTKQVGWSVAGDETDWTGEGSGTTVLAETPDDLTGVGNIANVIVIGRREGFHLAYASGNAAQPFRFEMWSRESIGCYYLGSMASDSRDCYFVGLDDVYKFNPSEGITPIGGKIRKLLLYDAQAANRGVKGFITRTVDQFGRARAAYNIVCTNIAGSSGNFHYRYDIQEEKWSRHRYGRLICTGFVRYLDTRRATVSFISQEASPKMMEWDASIPCEMPAYFQGRQFSYPPLEQDFTLKRVLVRCRDTQNSAATVTASSTLNATLQSQEKPFQVGSGQTGKWVRRWVDMNQTGNDFSYRVESPAGVDLAVNYISGQFENAGQYRGE